MFFYSCENTDEIEKKIYDPFCCESTQNSNGP
jgi:hypothetical protein